MGKIERVIVVIVCAGCLVVPAAMMLGGALEPEVVYVGGNGQVTYARDAGGLAVKTVKTRKALAVGQRTSGKPVVESSANDIPTRVSEERVHTDAHEMPVTNRRQRGLRPVAPPADE